MKTHLFHPAAPSDAVQWRSLLTDYSVLLFVFLFGYVAFSKLITFQMFSEQLARSPFISGFSGILAWLVPSIEIFICLLMILPFTRLAGVLIFTIIMMGFTAYIALMLVFSSNMPCICGGVISGLSWLQHLIFNAVFVLWGLVLLLFFKKELHP
ncbi:MAG TPA: MauE/DoxX family redox-associated membrane protein [Pedobacter sp.]|nr:MauE/DoxX family redox-associated membrane protein [Pedobacter sp.]